MTDPIAIARRFYELFNDRRLDEAGELVDPQAEFRYVPTRQRLIGRAGYRALAAAWLIAFEDARLEITGIQVLDDRTVVVDFTGHGTHTGDLVLGEAITLPATGRATHLPFRDRLVIAGGFILRSELDFDVEELKKRLFGEA